MPAFMPLPMLSSLRMPCPSYRPSSQTGTLNSTTCLLLLPHFVETMQSPCNGFHPTATCLATRLLTLAKEGTTMEQVDRPTSYPELKTILKAKQHSKWRHEHPRYNKADPYYLLTRREQAITASTITCIPNSALAIQSSALAVLAVRQQNIYCSSAPSTSHSERESGQMTLP